MSDQRAKDCHCLCRPCRIPPELPSEHPASETLYLQETLGHTPVQVAAGALLGLVVSSGFLGLWQLL